MMQNLWTILYITTDHRVLLKVVLKLKSVVDVKRLASTTGLTQQQKMKNMYPRCQ